jgi:ATP-dependent exoDNAse (exonuclease V) alpha subunit
VFQGQRRFCRAKLERFGWTFCPGDKVMQVENNYDKEVYNGDLGVVSRIDMEEGELTVDFDGRILTYGFVELDELVLAYVGALTSLFWEHVNPYGRFELDMDARLPIN